MWPMGVVVVEVLDEYGLEVAAAQDKKPIEALSTYGADEAFGDGVRARGPDRGLNDPDAFRDEDSVEGEGELGVAVADQELGRRCSLGEPEAEVPGLLGHPGAGWVRRDTGEMDDPGVRFDEEQNIEPAEQDGVDGEEVAREEPLCLDAAELVPGRTRPPREGSRPWRFKMTQMLEWASLMPMVAS